MGASNSIYSTLLCTSLLHDNVATLSYSITGFTKLRLGRTLEKDALMISKHPNAQEIILKCKGLITTCQTCLWENTEYGFGTMFIARRRMLFRSRQSSGINHNKQAVFDHDSITLLRQHIEEQRICNQPYIGVIQRSECH